MPQHVPQSLLLQWHITERCNLGCRHCYQAAQPVEELPYTSLLEILRQFTELLARWRHGTDRRIPAQVTLTGGEPFLREDFFELVETLAEQRRAFRFAILTNGTQIDADVARRLAALRPAFVQVSIDGVRETHDGLRGPGSFDRAVAGLEHLVRRGVRTMIAFSAHRANYREFPQVARLGVQLGVGRVWVDRVVPQGSGATLAGAVLTPEETRELLLLVRQARDTARAGLFRRTRVAMHRALQFLAGGEPYRCAAGDSLLAVMPNGDLYPCRRMPIRIGNLLEKPLGQWYDQSDLLGRLRDRETVSRGCERCDHQRRCGGGLRCLGYAVYGDPHVADPGCWHAGGRATGGDASCGISAPA